MQGEATERSWHRQPATGATSEAPTLARAFLAVAERRARREALTFDGVRVGYGELAERVQRLAAGLHAIGVEPGARVGVLLATGPHYVEALFAVTALGAAVVPIDPRFPTAEINRIVADAEPSVLLGHDGARHEQAAAPHATAGPGSDAVRVLTGRPDEAVPFVDCVPETAGTRAEGATWDDPEPEDLAAVFYTSGTGGRAAGVMHTHASLLRSVAAIREGGRALRPGLSLRRDARILRLLIRNRRGLAAAAREQVWMTPMGLHNISGQTMMIGVLLTGSRFVGMRSFHPRRALEIISRERVTGVAATPVMAELMLRVTSLADLDLRALFHMGLGGELADPALVRRMREKLGCEVSVGYGSTELGGPVLRTRLDDGERVQAETVGRPLEGVEVAIVDGERRPLAPGSVGELACRVEPMMVGYWRAPELTAAVTDPAGWYYTGDVAVLDPDGCVRILGRTADAVRRGGTTVHPVEIERALETDPRIRETAVVGVPRGTGDEELWMFVVAEPDAPRVTAPEAFACCRRLLAPAKVPDELRLRGELPRTPDGKIKRAALRREAAAVSEALPQGGSA